MRYWLRAGAVATGIYAAERWAGVIVPDQPQWVWLGLVAGCILSVVVSDVFTSKRRAVKQREREAREQEILQRLRDLNAQNLTVKSVREVIDSLELRDLGTDGTQYAPLPDGTNAVKLPDGSIRLATPVRVEGIGVSIVMGSASAHLNVEPPEGDQS